MKKVTTQSVSGVRALKQALKTMMKSPRFQDGVITVDQFRRQVPGSTVEECLDFLSNIGGKTDLIQGRRGHPSRLVFGQAFEDWIYSEARRAEWRKANGRDPATGTLLVKPTVKRGPGRPRLQESVEETAPSVGRGRKPYPKLDVRIGNTVIKVPVSPKMLAELKQ